MDEAFIRAALINGEGLVCIYSVVLVTVVGVVLVVMAILGVVVGMVELDILYSGINVIGMIANIDHSWLSVCWVDVELTGKGV